MATKAGALRVVTTSTGAQRQAADRTGGRAQARIAAAFGRARQRQQLGDTRSGAELGRATGARC